MSNFLASTFMMKGLMMLLFSSHSIPLLFRGGRKKLTLTSVFLLDTWEMSLMCMSLSLEVVHLKINLRFVPLMMVLWSDLCKEEHREWVCKPSDAYYQVMKRINMQLFFWCVWVLIKDWKQYRKGRYMHEVSKRWRLWLLSGRMRILKAVYSCIVKSKCGNER